MGKTKSKTSAHERLSSLRWRAKKRKLTLTD